MSGPEPTSIPHASKEEFEESAANLPGHSERSPPTSRSQFMQPAIRSLIAAIAFLAALCLAQPSQGAEDEKKPSLNYYYFDG